MKFFIQNLCVYFPFKIIFPEQIQYMYVLKKIVDRKKLGIMGIPPGIGFYVTTISFFTSYNFFSKKKKKLVYCTRKEKETNYITEQSEMFLKKFTIYSTEKDFFFKLNIISLNDKTKLCINPVIKNDSVLDEIEDFCQGSLSSYLFSKKKEIIFYQKKEEDNKLIVNDDINCLFFSNYIRKRRKIFFNGIWTIFKLRNYGIKKSFCPFFLSKDIFLISDIIIGCAEQIFFSDFYASINRKIVNQSFLILDNIFDLETLNTLFFSMNIDSIIINDCQRGVFFLKKNFYLSQKKSIKKKNCEFFFINLIFNKSGFNEEIRKINLSKNFFKKKKLNFYYDFSQQKNNQKRKIERIYHIFETVQQFVFLFKKKLEKLIFQKLNVKKFLDYFFKEFSSYETSVDFISVLTTFLANFISLLGFFNFRKINGMTKMIEFLKLIWINSDSLNQNFKIFFSPKNQQFPLLFEPSIELVCMETCFLLKSFLENFSSVVICSSDILNLSLFFFIINCRPKIFGKIKNFFEKKHLFSVFFNIKILGFPTKLKKIWKTRRIQATKHSMVINKIIENIPEGILCLFPSKFHIEKILKDWDEEKFLNKIFKKTKIFFENLDTEESLFFFDQYRLCCDFGMKALFVGIYGGILSKANLYFHFSKAFLMIEADKIGKNSRVDFLLKKSVFLKKPICFNEFKKFYVKQELVRLLNKHFKSKKNLGIFLVFGKNKKFFEEKRRMKFWIIKTTIEKNYQIKYIIKKIQNFFINKYDNFNY